MNLFLKIFIAKQLPEPPNTYPLFYIRSNTASGFFRRVGSTNSDFSRFIRPVQGDGR